MRAKIAIFFLFITYICGQDFEETVKIELCSVCTCSELRDEIDSSFFLNIMCTKSDRIVTMPDLDKIEWPQNKNRLKVKAVFKELGLSTLGKLPPNSYVEVLSFTTNNIKLYWPDPFSDIPSIKSLSLDKNELESITSDFFTNLRALEELNLSENKLTSIQDDSLAVLKSLKKLFLQGNAFRNVPMAGLQDLDSLEELDLSSNRISDVLLRREDHTVFTKLKRLNLNKSRIRTLTTEAFPELNSLEYLDLSSNIIETVDEDTFISCTSLTELNLSKNNITFNFILPSSVSVINLAHNTIHRWPDFPDTITLIDLSYNRLSDVLDNDVQYNNLEVLNLAGNHIKDFVVETSLPNLYVLDISYNLLEQIPHSLNDEKFPNLRELILSGNPIHSVYFKFILTVRSLYMDNLFMLSNVGDKAFSNVIGRPGEVGEKPCFSLSLASCGSLSDIKDGAFEGANVCSINLSENNLTTLSSSLLDWTGVPDEINLQGNPWDCDCHLQWILDKLLPMMYTKHSHLLNDLRCGSPRGVQDLRLVHWYNWTEKAMCGDMYMRSGPNDSYLLEPKSNSKIFGSINSLSLILGVSIIVVLLIAIALTVYLVKTRKQYRVKQAAMRRKRQNLKDFQRSDIIIKDQYKALNRS